MIDPANAQNFRKGQKPSQPKPRFGLFEFIVGAVVCVGFPAAITAFAPASWLEFHRVDQRVNVQAKTCVFFVVPYRTQQLADVREVSTKVRQGELLHKRPGDGKKGRAESEGTITLLGPEVAAQERKRVAVSVSPASLEGVEGKIRAFLADPQQEKLSLFTVANWKFGVIFPLPLSLLTVLFVVGWTIWLGQALLSPLVSLWRHEPDEVLEGTEGTDRE